MPFSELSEAEQAVWDAFPEALPIDLAGAPVRAGVIAALLLGGGEAAPGRVPAVRVSGARITGVLDLSYAEARYALLLTDCEFEDGLDFTEARTGMLRLARCRSDAPLRMPGAQVSGTLDLAGAVLRGDPALDVAGLSVERDLVLRGARLLNPGGVSLHGDGMSVGGGLTADQGLDSEGEFCLQDARIGGRCTLVDARLTNPGGRALNAEYLVTEGALVMDRMVAEGQTRLQDARIGGWCSFGGATLKNPRDAALFAGHLVVEGTLYLNHGFNSDGVVTLRGAAIRNSLSLENARLSNPDETAFRGRLMSIGGGFFAHGLVAHGKVSLGSAEVRGSVSLDGAALSAPGRTALSLWRADVKGMVACNEGFTAAGKIILDDAQIGAGVEFKGARIEQPGGVALSLVRAHVIGSLNCNDGFQATGGIVMEDAKIGAAVEFRGARISAPGARALTGWGLSVGSILCCCEGFTAEGKVSFASARVGSELCFDEATIDGELSLRAMKVGSLRTGSASAFGGGVDLRHATVGVLNDRPERWPAPIRLNGMVYDSLRRPLPVRDRLAVLDRGLGFRPQPYEQLAAAYRRQGHDAAARRVLLTKHRRHRAGQPVVLRLWSLVQDWTVGYGFRPYRAAGWLAALLLVGTIAFGLEHPPAAKPAEAPPFNPFLFTLDLLLPVIGFGQEGAFNPRGWQQWLAAALIAAGWVLATTIVAGVSRNLSRQ